MTRHHLLVAAVVCTVIGAFVLFLAVSDASCQERTDTRFKLTAASMAVLGATDVIQTSTALHSGQFREGNPALGGIVSKPWLFASVKAGALVGAWTVSRNLRRNGHGTAAWVVLGSMTAVQGAAVLLNARTLAVRR